MPSNWKATREYSAAYRAANRERIRENYRRWREKTKRENPEKLKAVTQKANHREGAKARRSKSAQKHRPWLRDGRRTSKNRRYIETVIDAMPPELREIRRVLYEFNSRVLRDGKLKNNQGLSNGEGR